MHILLPPLAKLRTVVDRLRPLANNGISFRANHAGELQLAVTTESARVEIGWTGLTNPPMGAFSPPSASAASHCHASLTTAKEPASQNPDGDDPDAKDPNQMHGVLVSHKCLLKFLSSHVVSTTTIACMLAVALPSHAVG